MAYYGVGLTTAIQELVFRFRNHVAKANPYCTLTRIKQIFQKFDKNANGKLSIEELDEVLKGCGMYLKIVELQAIIKYFDKDGDIIQQQSYKIIKCLTLTNFQIFLEPMNSRRRAMVLKVFNAIKENGISELDLKQKYNIPSMTTPMKTFVNNIEISSHLEWDSFSEFHEEISMNVTHDDTFIWILSQAWKIDEKQEDTAFQELLAQSIQELKSNIIYRAGGEKLVMKVFNEFDLNKSGDVSLEEFLILLRKLNLEFQKSIVNQVYHKMDRNNSGSIESQEFYDFFNS